MKLLELFKPVFDTPRNKQKIGRQGKAKVHENRRALLSKPMERFGTILRQRVVLSTTVHILISTLQKIK
jgi:hypothetical protein